MNETEFDDFIKNRYNKMISWYDKKALSNKKYYYFFQSLLIILSTLTPSLILFDFYTAVYDYYLKVFTVVVAIGVSILASLLRIFKFHDNWTTYRNICEVLRKEINFLNAEIHHYKNCDNKQALFVDKVESLISNEHNLWKIYFRNESI